MYRLCAIAILVLIVIVETWMLIDQRQDNAVDAAVTGNTLQLCVGSNDEWETLALEARVDQAECQAQWHATTVSSAQAIAQAQAGQAAAQATLDDLQQRWDLRSNTCTLAMAAAEDACAAEIGSY